MPWDYKYLRVSFRCAGPVRTAVACEHRILRIHCPGRKISVLYANYGRRNRFTCRHRSIRNTNCGSRGSTNIVRRICQNKRKCSVHASNSVFGDPCFGTYKYLLVRYICVY